MCEKKGEYPLSICIVKYITIYAPFSVPGGREEKRVQKTPPSFDRYKFNCVYLPVYELSRHRNQDPVLVLRGPVLILRGPVLVLRGPVLVLRGPVLVLRGPVLILRGPVLVLRGPVLVLRGPVPCQSLSVVTHTGCDS